MPSMSGRIVYAGAGNTPNVIAGQQYELAPFHGSMQIGCTTTVANSVTISVLAGPDVLQESLGVVPPYGTEQMPRYPDDYHWDDVVAQGDRLKLGTVVTAANTFNWVVRINPI